MYIVVCIEGCSRNVPDIVSTVPKTVLVAYSIKFVLFNYVVITVIPRTVITG